MLRRVKPGFTTGPTQRIPRTMSDICVDDQLYCDLVINANLECYHLAERLQK